MFSGYCRFSRELDDVHGRLIYCITEGVKSMELAVLLLLSVVLVIVATTLGHVAVTGPLGSELSLVVTGRFTIVVQTIENFSFTIVKLPGEE